MLSKSNKPGTVFQIPFDRLLDKNNPLYILTGQIEWSHFDDEFHDLYCHTNGRPGYPIRLMVGLHYLKYTYNLSDEELIARWVENPYWQYFCGEQYFQHVVPMDPSNMTRWRNRVNDSGLDVLLQTTIEAGLKMKVIKKKDLEHVNVDTTVSEKNITYPTDAKLLVKMIDRLRNLALSSGIPLKRSYVRLVHKYNIMQGRFRRSSKKVEAEQCMDKLRDIFLSLMKQIDHNASVDIKMTDVFVETMALARRVLNHINGTGKKIYSLHEPDVECITKGKLRKKHEYGCKVGIVTTSNKCFILSTIAFEGNPFDGHTLAQNLEQAKKMIAGHGTIKMAAADKGYRGHNYSNNDIEVQITKKGWRKLSATLRKWLSRRSAVEPVIGHMKSDSRLGVNFLKGNQGDGINAILCACGFNMRKLLTHIFCFFLKSCQFSTIFAKFEEIFFKNKTRLVCEW